MPTRRLQNPSIMSLRYLPIYFLDLSFRGALATRNLLRVGDLSSSHSTGLEMTTICLFSKIQYHSRHKNIDHRERDQHFPGKIHKLITAKPWKCPSDPHDHKYQGVNL